jgi:hypothetical protein
VSDLLVILILILPSIVAVVYTVALGVRSALRGRRRRRRRLRGLTDEEVADALAPFGVDISIWPSRAPRNGAAYEDAE